MIFTEGYLTALVLHTAPIPFRLATGTLDASTGQSGPELHLIPRTTILQAYLGYWPYRKGLKVDAAVHARLLADPLLAPHCKRNGLLSTTDKRDAYLAARYQP